MKVIFFDRFEPFPVKSQIVSAKSKHFFHFLSQDQYFKNKVRQIREKENIPAQGYPLKKIYESTDHYPFLVHGLTLEKCSLLNQFLFPNTDMSQRKLKTGEQRRLNDFLKSLTGKEKIAIQRHLKKSGKLVGSSRLKYSVAGFNKSFADSNNLVKRYGLPPMYVFYFDYYCLFNAFINITGKALDIYSRLETGDRQGRPNFPYKALSIVILQKLSKRQLIKWIDDHWGDFKDKMASFPQPPLKTSENLEIAAEIHELKKDKTYEEIAGSLHDKYSWDERLTDGQLIKMIHRRYKERLGDFFKSNK